VEEARFELTRIIHGPRLPQMQGAAHEAVVLPPSRLGGTVQHSRCGEIGPPSG
jgi:hypothetical protein